MSYKLFMAAPGLLALSACATMPPPQAGSQDAAFGEVTRYNAAIQTIDPDPVYTAEDAQPGDNGDKMADAVQRYRTDAVKETESISSTRRAGARGGGGSGPR